jgi:hypothetical protein
MLHSRRYACFQKHRMLCRMRYMLCRMRYATHAFPPQGTHAYWGFFFCLMARCVTHASLYTLRSFRSMRHACFRSMRYACFTLDACVTHASLYTLRSFRSMRHACFALHAGTLRMLAKHASRMLRSRRVLMPHELLR